MINDLKPRDFIASQAMQVLLEKFDPEKYNINHIAKDSYAIADALILASAK
jgi:hypothetical protein